MRSISHTFAATLAGGREVVVKVLRPRIEKQIAADISLLNSVILLIAVGVIVAESIGRMLHPAPVEGGAIAWTAGVGVAINGFTAWLFLKDKDRDLNVKGAYLHMAADALVSAIASAVNLVDVDTVLLGGLWTHFGDELATVLEGRLRSEILGYPNVKIRVFVPPVALHPSLYGAAEMGLRRFIENPLGYMGEK